MNVYRIIRSVVFSIIVMSVLSGYSDLIDSNSFDANKAGWNSKLSTNTAQAIWITDGIAGDTVYSGVGALSIVNPYGPVERWYKLNASSPLITEGTEYELSVWVKTADMALTSTYIEIDWLDSSDNRISLITSTSISTDQDWTHLTVSGVAPTGAVKLRPMLMVDGSASSTATVTFDEYLVQSIPEPATMGLFSFFGCAVLILRRALLH